MQRRKAHELEWPRIENEDGETLELEVADHGFGPDRKPFRAAFWDMLLPFLETLSHSECETFLRHHLKGETAAEIARSQGKATHTIEQSLLRSRRKLRAELEKAGYSYSALRQFLAPPAQ